MKKKLLVFPCGSEVALEIYRSMRYSIHFELVGGSSVDDHGRFAYENYIGDIPYCNDPEFIPTLKEIVRNENIDGIFPAMDSVARTLKYYEEELGCVVIGSAFDTTALCSSKSATYARLTGKVACPLWTANLDDVHQFPVFIKPDEGYGSRNVYKAPDKESAKKFIADYSDIPFVYCEYLPGDEYTIDCFSNSQGSLLFHGARQRIRVSNGISVHTVESKKHTVFFKSIAETINKVLRLRGAWFFQMKESESGIPILLEVAARLGGSSSYFRAKGVNFALLSVFDAFGMPVSVNVNSYNVEFDRALGSRYQLNINYDTVYVDFDDCLSISGSVNRELVGFLFQALNKGKKIVLITRHKGNVNKVLEKYRLKQIFDEVIHITDGTSKSKFIEDVSSVFIDDSFEERREVSEKHSIPVFSPDMIEMLLD